MRHRLLANFASHPILKEDSKYDAICNLFSRRIWQHSRN